MAGLVLITHQTQATGRMLVIALPCTGELLSTGLNRPAFAAGPKAI